MRKSQTKARSILNSFCDKVYVISLKKNLSNRNNIVKYLDKYNIEFDFFNAIDGSKNKLPQKYYAKYSLLDYDSKNTHELEKKYKRKLVSSPNAFALSLTYKKIFQTAIKNNYKYICILEEDFIFDKNLEHHLSDFLSHKNHFDMLYLGCSQYVWKDIKINNIENTNTKYYIAPEYIDGSFATIYSSTIYKDLIKEINRFNAPFDSGPLRSIAKKKNSYVIYPNIVIADTTSTSSISNVARNLRYHKHNISWNLKNMDFARDFWKVSVIMANHNNGKTIKQSIQSVLNQNYQNIEIIVVDDASTDNSVKTIKDMANKDKRIKPIYLKNNVGAYKARNIALTESTGFFISMLDPDDFYLSKKIIIDIYNYFNHDNMELFFSNMYRTQNTQYKQITDKYVLSKIDNERKPHLIDTKNLPCIYGHDAPFDYKLRFGLPTIFTDKTFFEKYGKWNEEHRYGMDLELVQRYVMKKYKIFVNHTKLWEKIYTYKATDFGIYLSPTTNYISFMSTKKNATSICSGTERESIHKQCNDKLQQELNKPIDKPMWEASDKIKKIVRENIKYLPQNFNWVLYSEMCDNYWLKSRQDCIEHYLSIGNTEFQNSLEYNHIPYADQDMMVCLCYFSHKNNPQTLENTNQIISKLKRANIPLFSAQLLYDDQKNWINADLTIRTQSQPLFYKENLWNIIYSKIRDKYHKILFIDSDVIFSDSEWYSKISKLLESHDLIQPFEDCSWITSGNSKKSIACGLAQNKPISLKNYHTGFAIGVNTNWFDKIGYFYDKAIIGGGDICFWSCVAKSAKNPLETQEVSQYIHKYNLKSYEKLINLNPPKIGYAKNIRVMHMDHNSILTRKYSSRSQLLPEEYEYLITKSKNGLIEITSIDFESREYFDKRN